MTETKNFPTLVLTSTATGIGMMEGMSFSAIHECAEWLCGHPVWTHELAHKPTVARYRNEAHRQFPLLPTKEEAEQDWQIAAAKAVDAYGPTVTIERGHSERDANPVGTFLEMRESST